MPVTVHACVRPLPVTVRVVVWPDFTRVGAAVIDTVGLVQEPPPPPPPPPPVGGGTAHEPVVLVPLTVAVLQSPATMVQLSPWQILLAEGQVWTEHVVVGKGQLGYGPEEPLLQLGVGTEHSLELHCRPGSVGQASTVGGAETLHELPMSVPVLDAPHALVMVHETGQDIVPAARPPQPSEQNDPLHVLAAQELSGVQPVTVQSVFVMTDSHPGRALQVMFWQCVPTVPALQPMLQLPLLHGPKHQPSAQSFVTTQL